MIHAPKYDSIQKYKLPKSLININCITIAFDGDVPLYALANRRLDSCELLDGRRKSPRGDSCCFSSPTTCPAPIAIIEARRDVRKNIY